MHICHTELQSNMEKPPLQMFLREKGRLSLSCIVRKILLEGTRLSWNRLSLAFTVLLTYLFYMLPFGTSNILPRHWF